MLPRHGLKGILNQRKWEATIIKKKPTNPKKKTGLRLKETVSTLGHTGERVTSQGREVSRDVFGTPSIVTGEKRKKGESHQIQP